jgi:UDP-N-acetyl-D-glucosamine dehydrogenase
MSVTARDKLLKRIKDKSARIGIIGLGYVGLPLILGFSEAGFPILGFYIDPQKIGLLNAGKSYFLHISNSRVSAATEGGLVATSQFSRAGETDVSAMCVPPPLNRTREPDLSFVIGSLRGIMPFLHPGQLICLESTTYPGTTEEEATPFLHCSLLSTSRITSTLLYVTKTVQAPLETVRLARASRATPMCFRSPGGDHRGQSAYTT